MKTTNVIIVCITAIICTALLAFAAVKRSHHKWHKGWECHGEFHACIQLDSFANDYTATSDCTVLVDCNKPIKIALRPAPSQHKWNVETPVKEVTVTLTL